MRKRKKSKWPALLLVLLALALVAFVMFRFVLVVRTVEIQGNAGMAPEDVIRLGNIGFGESIFRVDEAEIARSINSSGNVAFEGIEKDWPDGLLLRVRPRNVAAMMMHTGKLLLLDETGCAMGLVDEAPDMDLVLVSKFKVTNYRIGEVVIADEAQVDDYCAVIQAIQRNGATGIVSELIMGDSDDLRIMTRRGIEVELGNREKMIDKIAFMKGTIVDLEIRGEHGGIIDVSSGTKADYAPNR